MLPRPNRNDQRLNQASFWVEGLKTVGMSLFLAFGIRTFAAQAFFISSGSMELTLEVNDKLMVDKLSYDFTNPQRGNIVVFNPTKLLQAENFHDVFVKRVMGLPGDKVLVRGGRVYVNNCALAENYIAARPDYNYGPVVVPPNSYLVLGDNRNNSYDSHYWGFVPRNNIIGRAAARYWPLNRLGMLEQSPTYLCSHKKT